MPRPKSVPSYCLHKPSGRARVILDGRQVYLGAYGSPESREAYARLIAERFCPGGGNARTSDPPATVPGSAVSGMDPDLPVNELALRYIEFAETYYVRDGKPTGEVHNVKDALRSLCTLYGTTRAAEFGPRALKLVREHMIDVQDLCRGVLNGRIDRIKRVFKWAVSEELVPSWVYEGLRTVSGLRFGRSDAREAEPVRPVPDADVNATLAFLPPIVADMVRLQRITGMRSDNLVTLRPCDLDRSADIWVYEPLRHKTQHHKRKLFILVGPKARAILESYLTNRLPSAFCFSPAEVSAWHLAQRAAAPRARHESVPVRDSPLAAREARSPPPNAGAATGREIYRGLVPPRRRLCHQEGQPRWDSNCSLAPAPVAAHHGDRGAQTVRRRRRPARAGPRESEHHGSLC